MRDNDGRKLDHRTLEVLRLRAVEQVRAGAHPEDVATTLGLHRKTGYGWLAKYREGGPDALLEIHHIPKRRSWLNIAEIKLSALSRQCLDRRISDLDTLNTELTAWQHAINAEHRQIRWQFTTHDARVTLRHLYPKF